jgi:hypothetical protein
MPKLTLNIDERVIESGKDYARRHKTSLSRLVTDYLRSLIQRPGKRDPVIAELHEELLASNLPRGRKIDASELRRRHVVSKYIPERR